MQMILAQYKQPITTAATTAPLRMIKARCQLIVEGLASIPRFLEEKRFYRLCRRLILCNHQLQARGQNHTNRKKTFRERAANKVSGQNNEMDSPKRQER